MRFLEAFWPKDRFFSQTTSHWNTAREMSERVHAKDALIGIAKRQRLKGDASAEVWESTLGSQSTGYSAQLYYGLKDTQWGEGKIETSKGIMVVTDTKGMTNVYLTDGTRFVGLEVYLKREKRKKKIIGEHFDRIGSAYTIDSDRVSLLDQIEGAFLNADAVLTDLRWTHGKAGNNRKVY